MYSNIGSSVTIKELRVRCRQIELKSISVWLSAGCFEPALKKCELLETRTQPALVQKYDFFSVSCTVLFSHFQCELLIFLMH